MFEIKIKTHFSAAHNLVNYKGKCEHLHGHNWVVEAVFAYTELAADGMAIDFHDAKKLVNDVVAQFDHSYLNEVAALAKANPTSESVAKLIYDQVKAKNNHIHAISVWENEGSCATYREGVS